jgi:hypothetical protein
VRRIFPRVYTKRNAELSTHLLLRLWIRCTFPRRPLLFHGVVITYRDISTIMFGIRISVRVIHHFTVFFPVEICPHSVTASVILRSN